MNYNLQIQKLLIRIDETSLPKDKINLTKQAISIADSNNDLEWGFELRIHLIDFESDTSQCIESFTAFAWLLNAYDNNPELFSLDTILIKYKWMINESFRNASISLEQLNNIISDFKKRLEENGYSLRTYYSAKADFEFYNNNLEMVRQYLVLRDECEVNNYLDSYLSEMYANIEYFLRDNNFEKAIQNKNELQLKKLEYPYFPFAVNCSFVRHYTRIKKYKIAEEYFEEAEEYLSKIENDQSQITSLGKLLEFLSITNKPKAWEYFEKYINWTTNCDDCSAAYLAMDTLNLLNTKGQKTLNVSPEIPWYRPDNTYNIKDLYTYYYNLAYNLCEKFDKRNGNDVFIRYLTKQTESKSWFKQLWQKLFN